MDGAVCEHSDKQKMDFLERAHSRGVVNIEMECTAIYSLCRLVREGGREGRKEREREGGREGGRAGRVGREGEGRVA